MAVQTGDRVKFVKLATPADYPSAQDIDPATLYFITSTKEVYLGSILISTGPSVTQTNSDSVNALHELLLSGSADNITRDEGARKTSHLRGNPADGTLEISGQLTDAYGVQSSRILTQAQYNALPQAEQENGTDYYISDANPTVNQALWNKVGTASLAIGSNLSDAVNLLAAGGGGGGSATHYHVFGIILDSHNEGTMTARGCADITIVGNLARVDFMITEKYNATHEDGYNWGINPALFTQIDPNIPLITPIASQGSWDTFGYNWDRMQYGTTFDISGDRWRPVRYYTTSGDKGAWSEYVMPNQYRGTCYGTI